LLGKFDVTYISVDDLQAGNVPQLPCDEHVYRFVPKEMVMGIRKGASLAMAAGWMDLDTANGTLNDQVPELKSLSVAQFFSRYAEGSK
jgi:hypothetical protein